MALYTPLHRQAARPLAGARSARVVVRATPPAERQGGKIGSIFLSGLVSFTSATLVYSPLALADEDGEAAPAPALSAYERSKLEMERRRDLLRQAREKAAAAQAQKAAETSAPAAAEEEEGPKSVPINRFSWQKAPAPEAEEAPKAASPSEPATEYRGFSFGGFGKSEAPAPEAAPPPPPPAPKVTPKPEPVKAAPKVEEKKVESKKRRGPLPMFLAQVLVLGLFAGVGAAATKYNDQTTKALNAAGDFIKSTYQQVEKSLAK